MTPSSQAVESAAIRGRFILAVASCVDAVLCDAGYGCGPQPPPTSGQPLGPEWDIDGDSISNNTELHPPNSIYGFRVDTADMNPSKARGTPTAGSIDSAINLPDEGTMYVHKWGDDAPQTDDWGILALVNVIEGAGRRFNTPQGSGSSCRVYSQWSSVPRIQINDLSHQNGGQFGVCHGGGHCSHQNGLDVDVRYLRNDASEQPLNLDSPDSVHYDILRTVDLLWCFIMDSRVQLFYYDSVHTGIDPDPQGILVNWPDHSDHFHVRIRAY